MNFGEIEVFLVLSEELHFGRTAERLYLSPSRVSRLLAALEADVGGALFDRTSRRVEITPLGAHLQAGLRAAMSQLDEALRLARREARGISGSLRIGFTATTMGEALTRLIRTFVDRHPDCEVVQREVPAFDPYAALRGGEIDVLVDWLSDVEPDLTLGPEIDRQPRVLAIASGHPLARRTSLSVEDLGGLPVAHFAGLPAGLADLVVPPATPSGVPIPRTEEVSSVNEIFALVALGKIVHPTAESISTLYPEHAIHFIPIRDLPPLALGLIWVSSHENARIRGLAEAARLDGDAAGGPGKRDDLPAT
jgi:DNA-binding transcriptional LysR family regulator